MGNKKAVLFITAVLTSILCLSLYLILTKDDGENVKTVIIIENSVTDAVQSSTDSAVIAVTTTRAKSTDIRETTAEAFESTTDEYLLLNINTATAEELIKLDGIGEVIAGRIIGYREQNGGFRNIEEIMNVDGIGESKFNDISGHIYVENPVYEPETPPEECIAPEESEEKKPAAQQEEPVTEAEIVTETNTETDNEEILSTEKQLTLEEIAPVNINTADSEELMLLPYVTEEIAEKIIELRDEIGGYSHPYELLYIEELQQNQVAEIIEFVTVGQ